MTKLFAQECSCLKGWFGQRVPLFGFAQRKSTCPLEIEQMVEKGKGPLSSQEKAGLFPESLGRGAKREVKGGPRGQDELGRGCQGDQMVRCCVHVELGGEEVPSGGWPSPRGKSTPSGGPCREDPVTRNST